MGERRAELVGPSPPAEYQGSDRATFGLLQRTTPVGYTRAGVGILRGHKRSPKAKLWQMFPLPMKVINFLRAPGSRGH